jgi:hypothetical protein
MGARWTLLALGIAVVSCSRSRDSRPVVVDAGSIVDAGWEPRYDQSADDVLRYNARFSTPAKQEEVEKPRAYTTGCSACTAAEFCDRDHCAPIAKGGSAYIGGTFGAHCDPDPPNPQLRAVCGTYRCIDDQCRSCRTDADCCVGFPDCTPGIEGDVVCVYWSRIGRNECWFPDTFSRAGITPP